METWSTSPAGGSDDRSAASCACRWARRPHWRLLTPAIRLVAMVATFTNFINLFKDLGLSWRRSATTITHNQVSQRSDQCGGQRF